MSRRINLTIPDELHRRLEERRDDVNVSEVLTAALEMKLAELDADAHAGLDLDKVAARLALKSKRSQRRAVEDETKNAARRWVIEYFDSSEYGHLRALFVSNTSDAWAEFSDAINEHLRVEEELDEDLFREEAQRTSATLWEKLSRELARR